MVTNLFRYDKGMLSVQKRYLSSQGRILFNTLAERNTIFFTLKRNSNELFIVRREMERGYHTHPNFPEKIYSRENRICSFKSMMFCKKHDAKYFQ